MSDLGLVILASALTGVFFNYWWEHPAIGTVALGAVLAGFGLYVNGTL